MPRAGSGGGHSSSHRSSGGHSSSRSSGGHRISSSGSHRRAGSGRSSSSHAGSGFGSSPHRSGGSLFHSAPPPPRRGPGMPPPPPRRGFRRRSYHRTYYGSSSAGSLVFVIAAIILLIMILTILSTFFAVISSVNPLGSSVPVSTGTREKLDSGLSFDRNCIVDELGWFDSVQDTGKHLKTFYDKTGIQPYIVLLKYHPELVTDSQKETYAQNYYEDNIDNETTFLYMYFAEEDQDGDEVGYMCYVNGKRVDSVMDEKAVNIFWGYLDRDWHSDMSTDALFENAFTKTADTIMTKSRTKNNVVFVIVAGIVIIAVIAAMNARRRHKRERSEETS